MARSKGSKVKKERGRSPTKSEKGGKKKGDRSDKKDKKDKKKKTRVSSSSSSTSSSEDAAIGAEAKVAQVIAETFGVKPKMLKFSKQIVRMSDLSPYLLACVLCRATPDLTEQTVMNLGGELYEVGCAIKSSVCRIYIVSLNGNDMPG